jgi:FHS family L-fucose permease-like MFS transporter
MRTQPVPNSSYGKALALLATLFFMWGFISVINNTLLPHLRSVFELNYTQTTLIESVWFIAYGLAAMPSAFLIERIGYKRAIIFGLVVMAAGALGMVPAARLPSFEITLLSLFVIAAGIALLQVAANPYVAVIGPAETSESRLTLVQAFNSTGTFFAPYFGGYLILSRTTSGTSLEGVAVTLEQRMADAQATQLPYLIVAVVLAGLAVLIWRSTLPELGQDTRRANAAERRRLSLLSHRNLVFGIPAIFLYVLAEIGVANLFISFVSQPSIGNMTHAAAANYLILLWAGMMVGRFGGSYLLARFNGGKVLACFAMFSMLVMVGAARSPARPRCGPSSSSDLVIRSCFRRSSRSASKGWDRSPRRAPACSSRRSSAARWWSSRAGWPTPTVCRRASG